MKNHSYGIKIILWFCLSCTLYQHAISQSFTHIILISIDGLRPDFFNEERFSYLNLESLKANGVVSENMKSVFPSYTYPAHTAMLTGALPARSGIYYNVRNGSQEWNWFTAAIKVPTLWQAINQAGLTSAAIEWPVSVDSNITYNIPEIWNAKFPSDRISEIRKYATKGLIEEIELNATGKLDSNNMHEEYMGLDDNAGRMAAYIFTTYKPNFLAVHFAGVDGKEHEFGIDAPQVKLALANVDHAIGVIMDAVERSGMNDSTTIIVVGDHGFCDIHTVLRPNILLKDLQSKFVAAGGSAFLYGNSLEIEKVKMSLKQLPNVFRIIEKSELDKMGADSSATLALAAKPGYIFSGSVTGKLQDTVKGGHHGYDPNLKEMMTGFIAEGAGIKKGVVIKQMCVTDIAPLVAKLLGLTFTTPDGKLYPEMFTDNSK